MKAGLERIGLGIEVYRGPVQRFTLLDDFRIPLVRLVQRLNQ